MCIVILLRLLVQLLILLLHAGVNFTLPGGMVAYNSSPRVSDVLFWTPRAPAL